MKKRVTKKELTEKHTRVRKRHTTEVTKVKTIIKIDNLEDIDRISEELNKDAVEPVSEKKKRRLKKSDNEVNEEVVNLEVETENND